jgi:hypothetical protein
MCVLYSFVGVYGSAVSHGNEMWHGQCEEVYKHLPDPLIEKALIDSSTMNFDTTDAIDILVNSVGNIQLTGCAANAMSQFHCDLPKLYPDIKQYCAHIRRSWHCVQWLNGMPPEGEYTVTLACVSNLQCKIGEKIPVVLANGPSPTSYSFLNPAYVPKPILVNSRPTNQLFKVLHCTHDSMSITCCLWSHMFYPATEFPFRDQEPPAKIAFPWSWQEDKRGDLNCIVKRGICPCVWQFQ